MPASNGTMAFLFKSKKNADKAQAAKDGSTGVAGSQSSFQSSNGRMNEKGAVQQSSTPSSSVNNSMNSLQGGTATPSPEQVNRRGPSSEQTSDLPVSEISPDLICATPHLDMCCTMLTAIATERFFSYSPIDECKSQCLTISLVSTAVNIHDLSSKSFSSIWRCCQFCGLEGGGHLSHGGSNKQFDGEGRLMDGRGWGKYGLLPLGYYS